ncbi:hypothetical protein BGZ80_007212 [Entomortierella chlamydospora]|uniref:Uncharacterized protein n=1 Tax=Entomortierella chlamydospora TaxID=101097 RepID=A0A9P6MF86_9FUNG|nr:hypothetical protein BGZ79_004895 [Entomortierella chlamydospora]KAF9996566.1 hypothetical protein BGZ80_007212 [Entomortierella chlamydospora]
MFKHFTEYDDMNGYLDGSQDGAGEGLGVLYLRGSTQTYCDHLKNKEVDIVYCKGHHLESGCNKRSKEFVSRTNSADYIIL